MDDPTAKVEIEVGCLQALIAGSKDYLSLENRPGFSRWGETLLAEVIDAQEILDGA